MSLRDKFVARFGERDAAAMEKAAEEHKTVINSERIGSDPFRWAVMICIGYQCFEKAGYREHHGITACFEDIREWLKANADLSRHDGDVDYLALAVGKYNEYVSTDKEA